MDPSRPFIQQLFIFLLHGLKASDPGADGTAYPIRILLLHGNPGILQSLRSCGNRILGKQLHPFGRFKIHILSGVKIFHFCSKTAFISGCIEPADRSEACFLFFYSQPELLHTVSYGGDCSHSGYYDSSHDYHPFRSCVIFLHIHSAVHRQYLPCDIGRPVRCKKCRCLRHVPCASHSSQRNLLLHLFFQTVR